MNEHSTELNEKNDFVVVKEWDHSLVYQKGIVSNEVNSNTTHFSYAIDFYWFLLSISISDAPK